MVENKKSLSSSALITETHRAYQHLKSACLEKRDLKNPIAIVTIYDKEDIFRLNELIGQEKILDFDDAFQIEYVNDLNNSFVIKPLYQKDRNVKVWLELKPYVSVQRGKLCGGPAPYEIKKTSLTSPEINDLALIIQRSDVVSYSSVRAEDSFPLSGTY